MVPVNVHNISYNLKYPMAYRLLGKIGDGSSSWHLHNLLTILYNKNEDGAAIVCTALFFCKEGVLMFFPARFSARSLGQTVALSVPPLAALLWVLGGSSYYSDSDYYWHIALGRTVAETGSLPGVDTLSWVAQQQGLGYLNHSWLTDLLLYRVSLLGNTEIPGAVLYLTGSLLLLSLALFALYGRALLAKGQRLAHRLADWGVIAAVWLCLRYTWGNPRPQQLALVLFALALYLLQTAWQTPADRRCFALPVLALLWANLHGGSLPMLLVMTALYLVLALLPPFRVGNLCHRRGGPARRFALLLGLELLAGCCNPYGLALYGQFFRVNTNSTLLGVSEWLPASWSNASVFFVMAGLLVLLWGLARQPVTLEPVSPLVLTAGFTLLHVRGFFWFVVCVAVFLLRQVPTVHSAAAALARCWRPGRLRALFCPLLGALGRAALPVVTVVSLAFCLRLAPAALNNQYYRVFPPELVAALEQAAPQRLYTSYNVGGMAIQAGFQSFVDSRAELYTPQMLTDAQIVAGIRRQSATWSINEALDRWGFDAILLAKYDRELPASYFAKRADWQMVYDDPWYTLFVPQN